jgi:hypothetical protein
MATNETTPPENVPLTLARAIGAITATPGFDAFGSIVMGFFASLRREPPASVGGYYLRRWRRYCSLAFRPLSPIRFSYYDVDEALREPCE